MNILKLYVYKGIERELYFLVHKEQGRKFSFLVHKTVGNTSVPLFQCRYLKNNSVLLSLKTFAFLSLASLQLIRE